MRNARAALKRGALSADEDAGEISGVTLSSKPDNVSKSCLDSVFARKQDDRAKTNKLIQ